MELNIIQIQITEGIESMYINIKASLLLLSYIFSSFTYASEGYRELRNNIKNNECSYFLVPGFSQEESAEAIFHSESCARKYYAEKVDLTNFEQVNYFILTLSSEGYSQFLKEVFSISIYSFSKLEIIKIIATSCVVGADFIWFSSGYSEKYNDIEATRSLLHKECG